MSQDISKDPSPSFSKAKTVTRITVFAVTTAIQKLVKSNPSRLSLFISNISASHVYISPRSDVSTTEGIRLQANEGTYQALLSEDGALVEAEWFVIGAAAVNILMIETLRR